MAARDFCPSTYTLRRFQQPVRELLPLGDFPAPGAGTSATDHWGHRYVAGPDGVVIEHSGGARHVLNASNGLPVRPVTCVATAQGGDVWLGSPRGAMRWTGGEFEHYASKRWLPDDRVESIECLPDGSVRVRTPAGASHIRCQEMSLEEKAAHYEQLTDARHERFGYVTGCRLLAPGDVSQWRHNIDDNDGLWTAMYVAAQSFRYAVTKSEDARHKARRSLLAILELERQTGIPGFPARALTHKSEPDFGREREGEWHKTADGKWEWKGDTSSDEMDGHYFAWPIYYDLVADEAEKATIRATVQRVTDHIIGNGYYLIDADGEPTRWGVWAPGRLNDDPKWMPERGLNSLELLTYLKAAHHITGEGKYARAARHLIENHHYALNTIEQKILPGDFAGAENNHSDDELAFLCYYGLLGYETDPQLRAIYLASIERSWHIERPEKCPLWNFIYGAVTGRPCDVEAAVEALQEIPLDLIRWQVTNSHRQDLQRDPEADRGGRPQLLAPLAWRERPLHKWNGNPYCIDGGSDLEEECGSFWLLPYWMGRYHEIIAEAPTA
ncbi:MAG: hypothetical protein PVH68_00745 [Armatimonadota bacterium]|jgi:hypothetical protein